MKKRLIIVLMAAIIFLGATALKFLWAVTQLKDLKLNYTESTDTLWNPERGWYCISGCMVNDNAEKSKALADTFLYQRELGNSFVLILFNLANYQNRDISEAGIQYITNALDSVRKAGMKAIVRFEYDWDGKGEEKEPDSLEQVIRHMEQASCVLNENKDIIYLVQGILVGNYGEMNGSKYLDKDNRNILIKTYLELTDPELRLSVRTPSHWRTFLQTREPVSDFTQLPGVRIGLFNDGLCSSDTDLGTYLSDTDSNGKDVLEKWKRSDELDFQFQLCQYVPNGGETAQISEYNDLDKVVEEFQKLHISYLNQAYQTEVLKKWKNTSYHSDNLSDPYNGLDGYKYITDHLGYRFVLRKVTIPKSIYRYTNPIITVQIENTGFANLYDKKRLSVIVQGTVTGETNRIQLDSDIRLWKSHSITKLRFHLPIKDMKDSSYRIYLKIEDNQGNPIRLTNSGIFNTDMEANELGKINVKEITLKNLWE